MNAPADLYRDHTLLITTYDRPAYLRRLLEYVAAGGTVGTILVADASSDVVKAINARRIARLRADAGLTIEHHLFDHDLSVIDLHVAGVAAVATPFMTFVADDDFVVPAALCESVAFLRDNPDYAACAGRFAFAGQSSAGAITSLSINAPVDADDPAERFTGLLARYWSVEFGTWRTEVKRAAAVAFDVFALDEALGEPLHALCAALHGKIHVVDRIGSIRSVHENNNAKRDLDRRLLFARPAFPAAFAKVLGLVRDGLAAQGRACPADLAQGIMAALLRHLIDNRGYFRNAIGSTLARQLWPGLTQSEGDAVLARLRAAFDEEFLGENATPFRAAHEHAREAKVVRPGIRDDRLVTLTGDSLIIHDLADHPADQLSADRTAEDEAMLDRILATYAELFLDPAFPARYEAMRGGVADAVRDEAGVNAEAVVDALFMVMLAEDLGMHADAHGDELVDIMQRLPAARDDQDEIARLSAACLATRDHPDGRLWTDAAGPLPATIHERPGHAAEPIAGAVRIDDARQARDTTLIPLSPAAVQSEAWLHVRLHLRRGCLQLLLMQGESMTWTITVWPTAGMKSYYLPIVGCPEWLAVRDIGAGREPAHADLDAIELLTVRPRAADDGQQTAEPERRHA